MLPLVNEYYLIDKREYVIHNIQEWQQNGMKDTVNWYLSVKTAQLIVCNVNNSLSHSNNSITDRHN